MHQQPPKTPSFDSTSPANASQLDSSRALIVYPDPRQLSLARHAARHSAGRVCSRLIGYARRSGPATATRLRNVWFSRLADALEFAHEGVPLNVIQREFGHRNLGVTSIYLQGIDLNEIIDAVHGPRQPMIPASAGFILQGGPLMAIGHRAAACERPGRARISRRP